MVQFLSLTLKHNVLSDNYNGFEYNISKHFEHCGFEDYK